MAGRISVIRELLARGNDGDLNFEQIFDKIFTDLDARIASIEATTASLAELQKTLTAYGTTIIDQTVNPLVEQLLASADLGYVFTARSTSPVSLTANSATFVINEEERIKFAPPLMLTAVDEDNPANVMYCRKSGYNRTTGALSVDVLSANGSSTISSWVISAGTLASIAGQVTVKPSAALPATNLQLALQQLAYALGDNPDFAIDVADALADRYTTDEVDALLAPKATAADITAAIASLGLKTASQQVAQTGQMDQTVGALMQVGAFGLGLSAPSGDLIITDLNTATTSGFFRGGGTGTSNGPTSNFSGMLLVIANNSLNCAQIAIRNTGQFYVRTLNAGTWNAWAQATLT